MIVKMAFCQILFSVLVLSVVNSSIATSGKPVILWGDITKTSNSNPLLRVPAAEFGKHTEVVIKRGSKKIVFLEESLSSEDFRVKNSHGDAAYTYLKDVIEDSVYFPSVENPIQKLETLETPEKTNYIDLSQSGLSAPIVFENSNMIFINFRDDKEGESRYDVLNRHDKFIEETVRELQKDNDIVAIYTGRHPSSFLPVMHSRVRRQAATAQSLHLRSDHLLLNASSIILKFETGNVTLSSIESNNSTLNGSELSVSLNFQNSNSVILNFNSKSGYWNFDSVNVTTNTNEIEQLKSVNEVYALNGFSYRCGNEVIFANQNNTVNITLHNLKIQPFFETNANETANHYGDSFNCVGFFSVPIWSGLFVVFILLIITFYGIMMMMDIRTMDRFDDPKGKTITINASE